MLGSVGNLHSALMTAGTLSRQCVQTIRLIVQVTGANSGIGFQAAKKLAQNNASVVLASRNEDSGQRY